MSSAASSIQFYGMEAVVEAYRNKRIPAFSICAGKIMNCVYDGTDPAGEYIKPTINEGIQVLLNYLSSMYQGTTAIYTLKVYDNLEAGQRIRPSTEYAEAFNFRLGEPAGNLGMVPYGGGSSYQGRGSTMMQALESIVTRLEALEAREDLEEPQEEEQEETLQEAIIGVIKDPSRLRQHINVWRDMLGLKSETDQPAALGNIPDQPAAPFKKITGPTDQEQPALQTGQDGEIDERTMRFATAIQILERNDPKIVEHLEQLARIAEKSPQQFRGLIGMLELY